MVDAAAFVSSYGELGPFEHAIAPGATGTRCGMKADLVYIHVRFPGTGERVCPICSELGAPILDCEN